MARSTTPAKRDKAEASKLVAAGLAALKLGDQRNARDCFAQALALHPSHYAALYWMSYFARRRADALEYLQRALAHSRRARSGNREIIRLRVRELARGMDPGAEVKELAERARRWESIDHRPLSLPSSWLAAGVGALLLVLVTGVWVALARGGPAAGAIPAARDGGILIITPTPIRLPGGALAPTPTPTVTATSTPSPTATPAPLIHVVQPGDTLFGIALEYGVDTQDIQALNGIDDPSSLQIGQELVIPPTPTPAP